MRATRAGQIALDDGNSSFCYKNVGGRDKKFIHGISAIAEQTRRANAKRQVDLIQSRYL
jgi:hypothetical protein